MSFPRIRLKLDLKGQRFSVTTYSPRHFKDFAGLYARVFAEPPWNEKWTEEDVRKEFADWRRQKHPLILVARDDAGRVVGASVGHHIENFLDRTPYLKGKVPQNSYYLRDVAVHPDYRRLGLAHTFTLIRELHANLLGCDAVISRTHEANTPRLELFKMHGYRKLHEHEEVTGGVSSKRHYFIKDLKPFRRAGSE